ncbi:unnamed protein product [Phytomonas sp. EM1]|nr:unnamed protein product [Phytomonas sp. EM1]|eukprot:CCW64542.1 unnamed protein product [Phytomonas sp. isolate EM1]
MKVVEEKHPSKRTKAFVCRGWRGGPRAHTPTTVVVRLLPVRRSVPLAEGTRASSTSRPPTAVRTTRRQREELRRYDALRAREHVDEVADRLAWILAAHKCVRITCLSSPTSTTY